MSIFNDARYAVRALRRAPGFAVVAIVTLALGIGANTAIFSVVNGVLLRRLPYPNADRIVRLWSATPDEPRGAHSAADFLDFQRRNETLAALAGYREDALTVAPPGAESVRITSAVVTADFFDVFGTPAALGRTFNLATDRSTNEPLIVLSRDTWLRQLNGDPQAAGRRIRVNGVPHTIVGIMPGDFHYPEDAKAWVLSPLVVPTPPLDVPGDLLQTRDVHYFNVLGLVKPGVTTDAARADLTAVAASLAREFPQSNARRTLRIQPLHDDVVGDVRGALLLLLGAVGLVLLIACANVASLLLARASGRQRELAVRAALGASRGRLVRQLVAESLVLGAAGGVAGVIVGTWAVALLVNVLPEGIPRAEQIGLDARVAAIAVLLSLVSALLFGLVPAWQASRADASAVLHEAGTRGSTAGRGRARTRASVVVVEIALTLVLLVAAGLLINSFVRLQRVDPGFRVDGVTLVSLPVPQAQYPDGKRQAAFYQRVLESVRQYPGIQSAALLFPTPLEGDNAHGSFSIEGRPAATRADRSFAAIASISPAYFRTMGISIVKGRDFNERDREPAPAVIIVNRALARKYWGSEDPVGKHIHFGNADDDWLTVAGIVADAHNVGLREEPVPMLYLPYQYFTLPFMSIAVRSDTGTATVATAVREAVRAIDPEMPIDKVKPIGDLIAEQVAEPRFRTMLIGAFALMAVLLAAVGVYGLISYSVAQRTREIGIRVALGARPEQVMMPVLKEGLTLALAGIAIGLAGAAAATRLLARFLYGVGALDPATFAAVAALLLAIALLASYIPSRRALRIDPIEALRDE
jgi:putative ABC transport system permease protein